MPHMQEEQRQTAPLDTPPRGMSTLFLLIHPLPPDPHPRYYCYELSTELSPALYLSSAIGPLHTQGLGQLLLVGQLLPEVLSGRRLRARTAGALR